LLGVKNVTIVGWTHNADLIYKSDPIIEISNGQYCTFINMTILHSNTKAILRK